MKDKDSDEIKDESWIQDLASAVNITAQLSGFNMKLEGKNKLNTYLYDGIKCSITKRSLWKSQL